MNTLEECPPSGQTTPFKAELASPPHPKDEALEVVQNSLEAVIEARKEERFYWVCALVIIVDMFMFRDMETWAAPVCLCFLQFLVLVSLGRKWGVDHIWTLTEKLIDKWDGALGKGSK